jgi:hypothetical protein
MPDSAAQFAPRVGTADSRSAILNPVLNQTIIYLASILKCWKRYLRRESAYTFCHFMLPSDKLWHFLSLQVNPFRAYLPQIGSNKMGSLGGTAKSRKYRRPRTSAAILSGGLRI